MLQRSYSQKYAVPDQKWDDEDGHYIVTQNTDLTDRCELRSLKPIMSDSNSWQIL